MAQKRVLLAEDEERWHRFVVESLEDVDIELTVATTYGETVRALRAGPYDLLILDNTLHECNNVSLEFIQMCKRFCSWVPKYIVHSAGLPAHIERDVKALGAEYLRKDYSYDRKAFRDFVLERLA